MGVGVEPGGGGAGGGSPVAEPDSASGGGDGGKEESVAVRMARRDEGAEPGEGGWVVAPGDLYLAGDRGAEDGVPREVELGRREGGGGGRGAWETQQWSWCEILPAVARRASVGRS